MDSIPRLDDDAAKRLVPIAGQPPDLGDLPPGCAFAPRCKYAMDRCRAQRPDLEPVRERHLKACFLDA
jgi:oligopeptide transport system ATP-binding protein